MAQNCESKLEESKSDICLKIKKEGVKIDFQLVCCNTIFPAHKVIFGSCSNYLLELFMKAPSGNFLHVLEDVCSTDVENMLRFVYEGKLQIKPDQKNGLLKVANELKIEALLEKLKTLNFQEEDKSEGENEASNLPDQEKTSLIGSLGENKSENVSSSYKSSSGRVIAFTYPPLLQQLPQKTNNKNENVSSHALTLEKDTEITATKTMTRNKNISKKPRIPTPRPLFTKPKTSTRMSSLFKSRKDAEILRLKAEVEKLQQHLLESNNLMDSTSLEFSGIPLLSSTRIDIENLLISKTSKQVNKELGTFPETEVNSGSSEKEPDQRENETFTVPVLSLGKVENNSTPEISIFASNYAQKVPVFSMKEQNNSCPLADLVEEKKTSHLNVISDEGESSSENSFPENPHQATKRPKLLLKDGQRVMQKFKKTKKTESFKLGSTMEEHGLEKIKRARQERLKALAKSDAGSDTSTSDSFELRRKLPIGKRRRIPASTRPILMSSSSANSSTISERPYKRPKFKLKQKQNSKKDKKKLKEISPSSSSVSSSKEY